MTLSGVIDRLYSEQPSKTLFHYSSLTGLEGIVQDRYLRATEIRYFNDASELHHFTMWLDKVVRDPPPESVKLLSQFQAWYRQRLIGEGPMVFVGCFTENGNLLSQWRGYCPVGRGVSLGFRPSELVSSAAAHTLNYRVGRCVYRKEDKRELAEQVVRAVTELARERGEASPSVAAPSQSFFPLFAELEPQILQIAALVKHPAFAEEEEWRAVSAAVSDYGSSSVQFRVGKTTLIPYFKLPLPTKDERLLLERVIVGPTPTMQQSMMALPKFLARLAACPMVENCQIPYREG